jgi:hypothetical protein
MHLVVRLSEYLWRPLTSSEEDTAFVLRLRASPSAQAAFLGLITREDHMRFLKLAAEREEINWIIQKAGVPVGQSAIYRIDRKNRRADAGRVSVTVPEVYVLNNVVSMYVIFEVLKLNKMCGEVLTTNTVCTSWGERFGFQKEGTLREHVLKDGVPWDLEVYGLLASEWERLKPDVFARFGEPEVSRHGGEDGW